MNLFSKLFGLKPSVDLKDLYQNKNAQIIDVRSPSEFASGHIQGSINFPLNSLSSQLKKIKKDHPVITCCASGMRSASAKGILSDKGYEVYNGGGWASLERKIS